MKQKRVTLVDVARRAKVSLGTASQALNNPEQVGPERLTRVMRSIEDLGYTRNRLAQGLRAKTTASIGLCVPHSRVSFFADLVYRFGELALAEGLRVMYVLSHEDGAKELEQIKNIASYDIEGLLLVPSSKPQPVLDFLAARVLPTVVVDRPLQGETRFDQAIPDNRRMMVEVATSLVAMGHRRILFIVRRRSAAVSIQRVKGLSQAQRRAPRPVTVDVIESGDSEQGFGALLQAALAETEPTATIVSNDVIAAWTMREFQARGIRCPQHMSLVTFDEPSWAEIVSPPLSIVRLSVDEMAVTAWNLLMTRLQNPALAPRRIITPSEVILRASVGPPAGEASEAAIPGQGASRPWPDRAERAERPRDSDAA